MVVGDGNRCGFSNAMDRRLLVRPAGPGDARDVRDGGVMGSAAADVTGGDIRHIIDVEGRTWGWRFASGRKLLESATRHHLLAAGGLATPWSGQQQSCARLTRSLSLLLWTMSRCVSRPPYDAVGRVLPPRRPITASAVFPQYNYLLICSPDGASSARAQATGKAHLPAHNPQRRAPLLDREWAVYASVRRSQAPSPCIEITSP